MLKKDRNVNLRLPLSMLAIVYVSQINTSSFAASRGLDFVDNQYHTSIAQRSQLPHQRFLVGIQDGRPGNVVGGIADRDRVTLLPHG